MTGLVAVDSSDEYDRRLDAYLFRRARLFNDCQGELVGNVELDSEARFVLEQFGRVETRSILQYRNARRIRVHNSRWKRDFLDQWAKEEAEHGRALTNLALGFTEQNGDGCFGAVCEASDTLRLSEVAAFAASRLLPMFDIVYAIFGAFQEHSVLLAYRLLEERIDNEHVARLLRRISADERQHYGAYLALARMRLRETPGARKFAGRIFRLMWKPVGYEAMGGANWDRVCSYLCPTEDAVRYLSRTDRLLSKTLELDLHLMEPAVREARARHAARSESLDGRLCIS